MLDIDDKNSIKYYIKKYLIDSPERWKDKKIIDYPSGNGITARIIKDIGGIPLAFDLFPEYFQQEDIECKRSNIEEGIPLEKGSADAIISQEGIEHFPNQLQALQAFNEVLKLNGTCLISTPNYSNLKSRWSYFIGESEKTPSFMPPNEFDSIWMTDPEISKEVYYGHIFLIGIQKLRVLAKVSGFKINKVYYTTTKMSNILLFILFYPLIYLFNFLAFKKACRKNKSAIDTYKEQFNLSISPTTLLSRHLMVEFIKDKELDGVKNELSSVHQYFGKT